MYWNKTTKTLGPSPQWIKRRLCCTCVTWCTVIWIYSYDHGDVIRTGENCLFISMSFVYTRLQSRVVLSSLVHRDLLSVSITWPVTWVLNAIWVTTFEMLTVTSPDTWNKQIFVSGLLFIGQVYSTTRKVTFCWLLMHFFTFSYWEKLRC